VNTQGLGRVRASRSWAVRQVGWVTGPHLPGGGGMPGTQREVPEGWPRQADPLGHLQAALSQVVRAQARAWLRQAGLRPGS